MKRLLAMAIVLLASSAAQAQYQFEYGGRTIRIDPDRGTVSIPGIYDNSGRRSKRAKSESKGDSRSSDQDASHSKPAPQDAKAEPQAAPPAPAPADTAAAPTTPAPPPAAAPAPPPPAAAATATQAPASPPANNALADTAGLQPPPAPPPPAAQQQDAARQPAPPPPPPAPTVAAVPAQTPPPAQRQHDPNSPVGVWLTEEKEGKIRIEQCGASLCGYSVDAKSNANGEQVLINMKPGKGQKWSGRILDPNTGSTYDSTIALKGPDTLRVQGCAFGGMFCGGQTWSRID